MSKLFRFRLSSLLVLITITCVVLTWYTINAREYRAELLVIENLNVGPYGYVAVLHEDETLFCATGVGGIARMRWHGPTWLRAPLERWGMPLLYRTAELELSNLASDEVAQLARLRHLTRIEVDQHISEDYHARLRTMFPQAVVKATLVTETETDDADEPFG